MKMQQIQDSIKDRIFSLKQNLNQFQSQCERAKAEIERE